MSRAVVFAAGALFLVVGVVVVGARHGSERDAANHDRVKEFASHATRLAENRLGSEAPTALEYPTNAAGANCALGRERPRVFVFSKILLAVGLVLLAMKFGLRGKLRERLRELGRTLDRFVNIAIVVIVVFTIVQFVLLYSRQ